jgi:hypothetical protein
VPSAVIGSAAVGGQRDDVPDGEVSVTSRSGTTLCVIAV